MINQAIPHTFFASRNPNFKSIDLTCPASGMSQTDAAPPEREAEDTSEPSPLVPKTGTFQSDQNVETQTERVNALVTFVDHDEKRYVFPWDECRTCQVRREESISVESMSSNSDSRASRHS
jgi:hypothetical protein